MVARELLLSIPAESQRHTLQHEGVPVVGRDYGRPAQVLSHQLAAVKLWQVAFRAGQSARCLQCACKRVQILEQATEQC